MERGPAFFEDVGEERLPTHISAEPCVNSADLRRQRTGSWERIVAGELPSLAGRPHIKGDTDVWADALLVKQKNVLQFLAAAATIGGTNLDFRLEKYT